MRFNSSKEAHDFLRTLTPEPISIHPTAIIYKDFVDIQGKVGIGEYSVVGKIGFGIENQNGILVRINHAGKVILEDGVEIGAHCAIDRSKLPEYPTTIGAFTKLDNHVHVAHNCTIAPYCLIAGGAVFGGSVDIGMNCFVGLNATIKNKVKIGKNVVIGSGSNVIHDIPDNCVVGGNPARMIMNTVRDNPYLPLGKII